MKNDVCDSAVRDLKRLLSPLLADLFPFCVQRLCHLFWIAQSLCYCSSEADGFSDDNLRIDVEYYPHTKSVLQQCF